MRTEIALVLGLGLLSGCPRAAQTSSSPSTVATVVEGATTRALLEAGDFRKRFIEVAKTVRPTVVTIASIQTVETPVMPFGGQGGSPFDFFFHRPDMPERGTPDRRQQRGMGSGVILDSKGTILTNNHVVENASELKVVLPDERELNAKLVGTDPKSDLAVIRINAEDLKGVELTGVRLGNSSQVEVGEWVMAVGAPFGLKQTVSAGIVSAIGRGHMGIADYEDFIQTDAAINPGNSGGPLVNLEGEVIGINTAIASRSGGNQGIGFAIPIDMARKVVEQLIATGSVARGYIGVFIGDLTPALAESFDFAGRDGVLVEDVEKGGPAASAGIKAGDIIFERDGALVTDVAVFRNGVASTPPEAVIKLKLWREGKVVSVDLKLGKLADEQNPTATGTKAVAAQPRWGLGLTELTPDARERFHVEGSQGALVTEVTPDSPADRGGVQPGDVVVSVAGDTVSSAQGARELLTAAPKDKSLRIRVMRAGHGIFVVMPAANDAHEGR